MRGGLEGLLGTSGYGDCVCLVGVGNLEVCLVFDGGMDFYERLMIDRWYAKIEKCARAICCSLPVQLKREYAQVCG